ncbi:hypothetical protein ACGFWF_35120 [Streptomyces sp. NPDC048581]|uniref:hypothetical protein n=1 Tax=Streptomyces sp. NPDC048581 TaxID=3365572 RepID=UPI0037120578
MRAARDEVGGEAVPGGAQPGDEPAVHEEVRQPAAGHRPRLRPRGREAEVAQGQPYVPAAVGVRVRLHLYADIGGVALGHLA